MGRRSLQEAAAEGPVVLDGGLASRLEETGHDLGTALWSARLLHDDPAAVVEAHLAYFDAGAQVATTASYQASLDGFVGLGLSRTEAERLIRRSVRLADQARSRCAEELPRWVVGSVGPYGATLADGSEYRGDDGLSVRKLRKWHRPRIELLAGSGVDALALETVPSLREVEALLAEVAGTGVPCWLSLTCEGDRTRAGEPAREAFAMAGGVDEVFAVGVNCTSPGVVEPLVRSAARESGLPVVVYPNSGESWDAERHAWTGDRVFAPEQVAGWLAAGARLVGGCCRVGPDEIAALAAATRALSLSKGPPVP